MFTKEGDIVLDPFIGSGTTAVACKLTKRKFIGFEIDKKYCRLAAKRLRSFDNAK
jgi:DNA modification methylase